MRLGCIRHHQTRSLHARLPSACHASAPYRSIRARPDPRKGKRSRHHALLDSQSPTTASTPSQARASPETESSSNTQPFAWERNWWPVHVLSYLDATRPTPVELLGMQLVLWRDAAGTWRCFRDSCPHRRVPLSEGRVEGGELVCSYHGWRFNEGGVCTAIPQAPDAKALAAATASARSCVTSFPTQEAGGLLWVWPDAAPTAASDAAAAQVQLPNASYQEATQGQLAAGWFMRHLPYDYDILLENIADPSHVPFAHHGYSPLVDRHKAPPIPFQAPAGPLQQMSDSDLLPSGLAPTCAYLFPSPRGPSNRILFHAPGLITIQAPQRFMNLVMAVPAGPGRSLVFTTSVQPRPATSALPLRAKLVRKLMAALPKWVMHVTLLKFFDGDAVFLNAQGHFLRSLERQPATGVAAPAAHPAAAAAGPGRPAAAGAKGARQATEAADSEPHHKGAWAQEYFMPMTCDRALVEARKWLDSVGGGGPVYPPDAAPATPVLPREQLLDRMSQHTKHCPDCRKALALSGHLAVAGKALAAAAFFALCCLASTCGVAQLLAGGRTTWGAAAAVLCGVLALRLQAGGKWLQQQLTFVDYVHADIP